MTSDCYSILGVTPVAEDVVIGAAYRALMRHYHPDTNPDPKAQERAREITAAYAVLRDPAKRAEYDASRNSGQPVWADEDEPERAVPPPLRTAGIASALFALVLVVAFWGWQGSEQPVRKVPGNLPARQAAVPSPRNSAPVEQLKPESERLADIRAEAAPLPPVAPPPDEAPTVQEEPPLPAPLAETWVARPKLAALAKPRQVTAEAAPVRLAQKAKPVEQDPAQAERVATLTRISAGFFSQSMVHATDAKKSMLLAARDRSAADRKACHSDSCVADAYVRQIRETSAIMESRAGPAK